MGTVNSRDRTTFFLAKGCHKGKNEIWQLFSFKWESIQMLFLQPEPCHYCILNDSDKVEKKTRLFFCKSVHTPQRVSVKLLRFKTLSSSSILCADCGCFLGALGIRTTDPAWEEKKDLSSRSSFYVRFFPSPSFSLSFAPPLPIPRVPFIPSSQTINH